MTEFAKHMVELERKVHLVFLRYSGRDKVWFVFHIWFSGQQLAPFSHTRKTNWKAWWAFSSLEATDFHFVTFSMVQRKRWKFKSKTSIKKHCEPKLELKYWIRLEAQICSNVLHIHSKRHSLYRLSAINIDNRLTHIFRFRIDMQQNIYKNTRHLRQSNRYWLRISGEKKLLPRIKTDNDKLWPEKSGTYNQCMSKAQCQKSCVFFPVVNINLSKVNVIISKCCG